MKKNITAFAVAAAIVAPAFLLAPAAAMADTTLYGKLNMSYDVWTGDKTQYQGTGALSSNASRLGVKGSEKISDDLSVIYQYETYIQAAGSTGNLFGVERNTFLGLTGGWGTFLAGKHDTPMKVLGRKYDLFGDTLGDSRTIIREKSGGDYDRRTPHTLMYATPDLGGFHAMLAYVGDYRSTNKTDSVHDAYSISAGYKLAGFALDAAYEEHKAPLTYTGGNTRNQHAIRVGAGFKMAGFKLVALYQDAKNLGWISGQDRSSYGLGAGYSFGANTIKAQYYKADSISNTQNTGGDVWAVGYDYKLSKQTKVYALYSQAKNENGTNAYVLNHNDSMAAAYPTTGAKGSTSSAVSVGLIHKF